MRLPFRRRRRRAPAEEPGVARSVDLGAATWGGRSAVTPVHRPDVLSPVDHPMPFPVPNQADERLLVTQTIAELHDRGALDDGSAAVLDHWIDSRLLQWQARIDVEAHSRRKVAALLYAVDVEDHETTMVRLDDVRRRLAVVRAQQDALLGEVAVAVPRDAVTPSDPAVRPPGPALPGHEIADLLTYREGAGPRPRIIQLPLDTEGHLR